MQPSRGAAGTPRLCSAARSSRVADGLITPEVTIGWGETSAIALSATSAAIRLFTLPSGRIGPALAPHDVQVMVTSAEDGTTVESLLALGSLSANAIIAPSSSAAHAVESDPALASRASDEPFVAIAWAATIRYTIPPAIAHFPPTPRRTLEGKAECRRALARRGRSRSAPARCCWRPRPSHAEQGREEILAALARLDGWTLRGDPVLGRSRAHRAPNILAIEHPAVSPSSVTTIPPRSAASAPPTARSCSATQRAAAPPAPPVYGTLPIVVAAAASHELLVDYDPRSATGRRICSGAGAVHIESAIRRAIALRADADLWTPLANGLFSSAPRGRPARAASRGLRHLRFRRLPRPGVVGHGRARRASSVIRTPSSPSTTSRRAPRCDLRRPGRPSCPGGRERARSPRRAPHLVAAQDDPSELGTSDRRGGQDLGGVTGSPVAVDGHGTRPLTQL